MNAKKAKQLRKIIPPIDPSSRRVYRRAKSQYDLTPNYLKREFMLGLARIFQSKS